MALSTVARSFGVITVVASAAFGMAACQKSVKLSVDNGCDTAIEADLDEVADPVERGYEHHWKKIFPGETAALRSGAEGSRRLYVWVRPTGSELVPEPFVFEPSDLATVPGGGNDVVASIAGSMCPL